MFAEIGVELIWTPSTEMDWGGPGLMRASWAREDFQRAARGELRSSVMDAEALRSPSANLSRPGGRGRE